MAQTVDLTPRKLPQRAHGKASFEAVVEGCARLLRDDGPLGLSTNAIADRAGVGIGTVYEFFPNKEAIVAQVAERALGELFAEMERAAEEGVKLPVRDGTHLWLSRVTDHLARDRELYRIIFREVDYLRDLPAMIEAEKRFTDLVRTVRDRISSKVRLRDVKVQTWLITRLLYAIVFELAFAEDETLDREAVIAEYVRVGLLMVETAQD